MYVVIMFRFLIDSDQKNISKLINIFKLETYKQYTKGSKLMELSLGEVTSDRDQISAIGFFSSIEIFLALKKVSMNACRTPHFL